MTHPFKATFSSSSTVIEQTPVKINGANYDAIDTKDGWFTVKDIMLFSEVAKGDKNAPEDVKAPRMQQMVDWATQKYQNEKFAAPAHKGHHKAIAFEDPEFLGFVLPKRVSKTTLDGKEQDAVFGDVKVKASAFERIRKGELPYVSPEVDWANWQFSSLAFLDSMPPHFKGPIITVGKVTEDAKAKFTVGATLSKGLFMALDEEGGKKKHNENDEKEENGEKKNEHDDSKMCGHCAERLNRMEASYGNMDKTMGDIHFKMGLPYKGAQMQADPHFVKPDSSAPKEDVKEEGKNMEKKPDDKGVKFADDPEVMAKFAAQEAKTKALEDRLNAKEQEDAKKARIAEAFEQMKGRPLTDAGKAGIAKFADDPEKLKTFMEVLKAQTPENPPKSVAAFEAMGLKNVTAVSGADPDVAAFQAKGPEAMAAALKYAAHFEAWKASPLSRGARLRDNRKAYIETMMELDPTGNAVKGIN